MECSELLTLTWWRSENNTYLQPVRGLLSPSSFDVSLFDTQFVSQFVLLSIWMWISWLLSGYNQPVQPLTACLYQSGESERNFGPVWTSLDQLEPKLAQLVEPVQLLDCCFLSWFLYTWFSFLYFALKVLGFIEHLLLPNQTSLSGSEFIYHFYVFFYFLFWS